MTNVCDLRERKENKNMNMKKNGWTVREREREGERRELEKEKKMKGWKKRDEEDDGMNVRILTDVSHFLGIREKGEKEKKRERGERKQNFKVKSKE